jgi:lysophospholipase L1-like esterase
MLRSLSFITVVYLLLHTAALGQNPADNPAARKLDRNIPRHQQLLQRIEQTGGAGDVIFLGDSITEGWEGQKYWQEHFGVFKPVNLGSSGDQTGHILWRITDGHELDKLNPKLAVIMIGTNNTGGHNNRQIAGGVRAIIDELRRQKPDMKVLLLGIFPRGNPSDSERSLAQITATVKPICEELKKQSPDVQQLNALIRALERTHGTIPAAKLTKKIANTNGLLSKFEDGKNIFYKDIGKVFLDADGGLSGEIMPDYLHLSSKGYDLWGNAIKQDIARILSMK